MSTGHCCACAGVCHHVGGPWYCANHGGGQTAPQPVFIPTVWPVTGQESTTGTINFEPCQFAHDFVVGPEHAVCNRCEKVVKL